MSEQNLQLLKKKISRFHKQTFIPPFPSIPQQFLEKRILKHSVCLYNYPILIIKSNTHKTTYVNRENKDADK